MLKRFKKFIGICEHRYILMSDVWLADCDDEFHASNIGFGSVKYHEYEVYFCVNCLKFKRIKTSRTKICEWCGEPEGKTYTSMDDIKDIMRGGITND